LLDYTQAIITGEELMFTLDMPYTPPQGAPIVLAQAAAAGSTPQPDYMLNACKETTSTGVQWSAMRAVDPAGMLRNYFEGRDNRVVELSDIKNVVMLQATQHGKIFSEVDSEGFTSFHYDADPNYEGNDKAIFMAEYQGKRYKIVVEMHVFQVVDESASSCPPPKLIKVSSKSVSDASAYQLNSFTVTFGTFGNGAVGQTTGTTITLDAAAGHALGLEHSADSGDFMAATLQETSASQTRLN
jgi:hypothetical protein